MKEAIKLFFSEMFKKENAGNIAAGVVLTGGAVALTSGTPFLFGSIISKGSIEFLGFRLGTTEIIKFYASFLFLSKVLPQFRKMLNNPLVGRIAGDIVHKYNAQLMKQPHSHHVTTPQPKKVDEMLITRTAATDFVNLSLNNVIPASFEVGAATGILFKNYGWTVGTWVASLVGSSVIYNAAAGGYVSRAYSQYIKDRLKQVRNSFNMWENFESVFYFNTFEYELKKLRQLIETAKESECRQYQVPDGVATVHTLATQATLLGLVLEIGGKLVTGDYSPRDLAIIVYFIVQLTGTLNNLGESINKIFSSSHEFNPIMNLMNREVSEVPKPDLKVTPGDAAIVFDHVSFSYAKLSKEEAIKQKKLVLDDVSFRIEPGKTLGIVGLSGGGKTSIARALFRLYDPVDGKIFINGQDITSVNIDSLRKNLAMVQQNAVLFNDTIRYNIAYGAVSNENEEDITDERIWDAIKKVGLEEFVNSSELKLMKPIGEKGLMLSGGQLLRIAIARAIIRNAPIMILDEYTSALDAKTERFIQHSFDTDLKAKTKIVIAHRLATIQNADDIIVLDKGKIVEQGTFAQLMAKNDHFKRLWDMQNENEDQIWKPDAGSEVKVAKDAATASSTHSAPIAPSTATATGKGTLPSIASELIFSVRGRTGSINDTNANGKNDQIVHSVAAQTTCPKAKNAHGEAGAPTAQYGVSSHGGTILTQFANSTNATLKEPLLPQAANDLSGITVALNAELDAARADGNVGVNAAAKLTPALKNATNHKPSCVIL